MVEEGGNCIVGGKSEKTAGGTEGDDPVGVSWRAEQFRFETGDERQKPFTQDETGFARFAGQAQGAEAGVEFFDTLPGVRAAMS